ncbi:PREDICTED: radical S-adenosyl methionine domain-containing protein 2 [Condylura cristata]|uniref:radical S-adenosyl methionine domain-containing protein 2 n=1 Tax=Condylura cristata TaxID=143302 RepID=UPI00064337B2|nr:PREDICTED: radical S-adenosyl methionine domain-containing protein 2 [Condylura cristata]
MAADSDRSPSGRQGARTAVRDGDVAPQLPRAHVTLPSQPRQCPGPPPAAPSPDPAPHLLSTSGALFPSCSTVSDVTRIITGPCPRGTAPGVQPTQSARSEGEGRLDPPCGHRGALGAARRRLASPDPAALTRRQAACRVLPTADGASSRRCFGLGCCVPAVRMPRALPAGGRGAHSGGALPGGAPSGWCPLRVVPAADARGCPWAQTVEESGRVTLRPPGLGEAESQQDAQSLPPSRRLSREYLDILAISCDSFDENVNVLIGRGQGKKSHVDKLWKLRAWCRDYRVAFKINSVINRFNVDEDMNAQIRSLNPVRWKVFQCLLIEGENAGEAALREAERFVISDQEFEAFLERHRDVSCLVPESNQKMKDSYLILDEYMRFLNCRSGRKDPSRSILDVGVEEAIKFSGFDEKMFLQRGGKYVWSKADLQLDW